MKSWNVEVTSKETIKPSAPTPHHLRTHKLSWLDRITPEDHIAFVLFYPNSNPNSISVLKSSLSKALTLFYPLAGRLNHNRTTVDIFDQGIDLFHARAVADAPLSRLVHPNPPLDSLSTLLPCNRCCSKNSTDGSILLIQVTTFISCGGIAIGCCLSHKIADGHSAGAFIDAWAATACGRAVTLPIFNGAFYFAPPLDDKSWYNTDWLSALELAPDHVNKLVTKRFVFDESSICTLRKSSAVTLTRVQSMTALIWRCCMRARESSKFSKVNNKQYAIAGIIVNMRGRTLPDNLFGNLCCLVAQSEFQASDGEARLRFEKKVSGAINKIDPEKLRSYQGPDGWSLILETLSEVRGDWDYGCDADNDVFDLYMFTSWLRFPFYEADFGWGKPIWVGVGGQLMKNEVVLMGRGDADSGGMEAWVTLEEEEMIRFERDEEINCFASFV